MRTATMVGMAAYLVLLAGMFGASFVPGYSDLSGAFYLAQPVALYFIWRRLAHRPVAALGYRRYRGWRRQFALAALIAAGFMVGWYLLLLATGLLIFRPPFIPSKPDAFFALQFVFFAIAVPLLDGILFPGIEEFVHRGFLFHTLLWFRGKELALFVSALLFAMMHVPRYLLSEVPVGLFMTLKLVAIFAFGVAAAIAVQRTGGLWFAWGWHFGSNFALFPA